MAQLLNILFVFLILHRLTHLSALLRHIKSLPGVSPLPSCSRVLPFACLPHACPVTTSASPVRCPSSPRTCLLPPLTTSLRIHPCLTLYPLLPYPAYPTLIRYPPPLSLTYSLPPPHPSPYPLLPHPTRRYAPTGGLNARIHKHIVELGEPVKV